MTAGLQASSWQPGLLLAVVLCTALCVTHTPLYAYSNIWNAGLKCDDTGTCVIDEDTGYYSTEQAVKRQDESIKPQLSPIKELTVLGMSSRLCMVVTGSYEHQRALTLASHIDYGWQQRDLFNEVCRNVITLDVNQRYNINASHSSNQNDPIGLSRTEDGLWTTGGEVLFPLNPQRSSAVPCTCVEHQLNPFCPVAMFTALPIRIHAIQPRRWDCSLGAVQTALQGCPHPDHLDPAIPCRPSLFLLRLKARAHQRPPWRFLL